MDVVFPGRDTTSEAKPDAGDAAWIYVCDDLGQPRAGAGGGPGEEPVAVGVERCSGYRPEACADVAVADGVGGAHDGALPGAGAVGCGRRDVERYWGVVCGDQPGSIADEPGDRGEGAVAYGGKARLL